MKRTSIMKLSLVLISLSLIIIWGLCGTGCGDSEKVIAWVVLWNSNENLGGSAGTDWDIFMTRSTDSGATWSDVQTLNLDANTDSGEDWEPRAVTDGNGNWVAVWWSEENPADPDGTDSDVFVSHSADNGASWSAAQTLNSNADSDSGGDYNPFVTTDGSGNWVAAWYSNDDLGATVDTDFDIFVSRSTDNGASWSAVQTLNSNADSDSGYDGTPCVMTDGSGNWVAAWYSNDDLGATVDTDFDIFVSRSTDNGASWSAVKTLNSNADSDSGNDYYPYVVTDSSGNWVAAWYSDDDLGTTVGTDYDIFVSRSTDNGASWSAVQALNSNADSDSEFDGPPCVMTDGSGNWVAVWNSNDDLGATVGTDSDIFVARSTGNGASWSAVKALNSNAASDTQFDTTPFVITDGKGNWSAMWESRENLGGTVGDDYDIFIAHSTDNGASWSAVQTLNSNANTDTGDDFFIAP